MRGNSCQKRLRSQAGCSHELNASRRLPSKTALCSIDEDWPINTGPSQSHKTSLWWTCGGHEVQYGLARISAPRPPKKLKPSAFGTRFTDWIGGICCADTLQVWFPANWAPVILRQLQDTEDAYRAAHPSWMDLEVAPDDIKTQWQEANANRRMQFKVGVYKDGDIRMLTGTIKADWIQLPVERYLTALPTLKQGVIAGVFKHKGAAPWAITRAEKLHLSVFLANDLSLDDWYAGPYPLWLKLYRLKSVGANTYFRVVG